MGTLCHLSFEAVTAKEEERRLNGRQEAMFVVDLLFILIYGTAIAIDKVAKLVANRPHKHFTHF